MTLTAHRFLNAGPGGIGAHEEARFFASIRLANGVFKTTDTQRMTALDRLIAGRAAADGFAEPEVLDVGVSSGVTTLELRDALKAAALRPRIVALDAAVEARLLDVAPGRRVLQDSSGRDLQYEILGVAIRPWRRKLDYMTGYWLLANAARALCVPGKTAAKRRLRLISPGVQAAPEIDIMEDDLSRPIDALARRFDIVRAANLLNLDYFSPAELTRMIMIVRGYMKNAGSFLIVNRTHHDGTNHGTIFKVQPPAGLTVIERVGNGSEVEGLVLSSHAHR
jgi:hypothetical protein